MPRNDPDGASRRSVAQLVREILSMRPFLLDALKMGIVNYSALARVLQREIGEGSLEAIKAAIIRVGEELVEEWGLREEEVLAILRESKVRLQDKIAVIISPVMLDIPYIVTAYLTDSYVYKTELREPLPEGVQVTRDLVALILLSPERVETTPGFVAFVSQLLASRNINIVEFISCSTNTVIVLDSRDALEAFKLLHRFT